MKLPPRSLTVVGNAIFESPSGESHSGQTKQDQGSRVQKRNSRGNPWKPVTSSNGESFVDEFLDELPEAHRAKAIPEGG